MLPSLNGNKIETHSLKFRIDDLTQIGDARRSIGYVCDTFMPDETRRGRVGIVVSELATNIAKYASGGSLLFRPIGGPEPVGVEILAVDSGPGLDVFEVMRDGFSTGQTAGTGLGAIKRQSDDFEIFSQSGRGTVVVARIYNANVRCADAYDVGAVNVPVSGEIVSGDGWFVSQTDAATDIIVVDGLGHGPKACEAASEGIDAFRRVSRTSVDQVLGTVHQRMKGTRGGAVFLVSIQNEMATYTGVGNIRAVVQSHSESKPMISHNGTAGLQIRTAKPVSQSFPAGGVLVLHTDGINSRWDLRQYPGLLSADCSIIAGIIYRDFNRGNDDATVVVLRRRP